MNIINENEQRNLQQERVNKDLDTLKDFQRWINISRNTDKDLVSIKLEFIHPRFGGKAFANISEIGDKYLTNRIAKVISEEVDKIIQEIK